MFSTLCKDVAEVDKLCPDLNFQMQPYPVN